MSLKATILARLKARFTRFVPANVSEQEMAPRDTVLDGVATGLGAAADRLTQFNDRDRFLVTAFGNADDGSAVLNLYAADRDMERGYKMSDAALRIILCDWWEYISRRGTYRGTHQEALWRIGNQPLVRSPMMAVCSKTGVTTPLGLNTCAIKALGVRYLYVGPQSTGDAVSDLSCDRLWAKLTPLRMHYSSRRLDPTKLVPDTSDYEVVVYGEHGTFAGEISGFAETDASLVANAVSAQYTSLPVTLGLTDEQLALYNWFVDWRAYESVTKKRIVFEIRWGFAAGDPTAWVAVVCGEKITPPTNATTIQARITFTESAAITETLEPVTAGATVYNDVLTLPMRPVSVLISDTHETFYDKRGDGVLVGSLGGSGFCNFVTGAVTLTFGGGSGSGGGAVTCTYWAPMIFDGWCLKSIHWSVV